MAPGIAARRMVAALLAVAIAAGIAVAPPLARETYAATPDLTLVGDARYEVDPANSRVRVTVDLVATNHLQDTATRSFYFDRAILPVIPGTTGFRLSSPTGKPSITVTRRRSDYTLLQLNLGQRIFSGKSASFQLRFDLPDPGGSATRDVRVRPSLVSFPVWAFATEATPGGSVTVSFPPGYTIEISGNKLPSPTTDSTGRVVYRSGRLADPLKFFSFFVADKPGSFTETRTSAVVNGTTVPLTIQAWPDDAAWARRVSTLFSRGLPAIGELVGLPWQRPAGLAVQEAVSRTTGGYAALFDPAAGRIEVAYYADAFVILHEASHAWFNGALLADRWANEAFASYYALAAAEKLGETVSADKLTDKLKLARIPLNAWGAVGREAITTEDYAYAASLELATALARRAGQDGLRDVWAAAAAAEAAYQPAADPDDGAAAPAAPEKAGSVPDWRGLLDLLEDRTGKSYDDLWRTWVVRDEEKALLDARRAARGEYGAVRSLAGSWELPRAVRESLRAWQFPQATQLLAATRQFLGRRAELEAAASAAGLTLPVRLETAFESGDGIATANAEANAENATIEALVAAGAARPKGLGPVEQIGLIGETPDAELIAARTAFEAGDLALAADGATNARAAWQGAGELGRNRVLAAIGLLLLVLLALAAAVSIWRARRTERAARSRTVAGDPPAAASTDPPGA